MGNGMKVNYFSYKLFPVDGTVFKQTLKDSVDAMIKAGKNATTMDSEYYVIQHIKGDVYSIIRTNSKDVFRKLDVKSNSCVDLTSILNQNEKIAFASFFILKKDIIGFGSTLNSPRINRLANMYDLFMSTSNSGHDINFQPVTKGVTAQDVMSFAHVGKITMKIEKSQSITQAIESFLSTKIKYDDIASFEIKIVPKRGKDIKSTFSQVMSNLPSEVNSVAVSAREAMGDIATDLNIIAANTVFDIVTDNGQLAAQMENGFNSNLTLRNLGY